MTPSSIDFRPLARIDHAALRHNLIRVRSAAPGRRIWAVVKASAYGHGLIEVAMGLAPAADGLAVARIDEALALRQAGLSGPILMLEGPHDIDPIQEQHVEVTVQVPRTAQALDQRHRASAFRPASGSTSWLAPTRNLVLSDSIDFSWPRAIASKG